MLYIFDNTDLGRLTRRKKPDTERAAYRSIPLGDPPGRAAREGKDRMDNSAKLWERQLIEADRMAEQRKRDGYIRAQWLQKRVMDAETEEEFDDLLDALHEQEEKNLQLSMKALSARGCLMAWQMDHSNN